MEGEAKKPTPYILQGESIYFTFPFGDKDWDEAEYHRIDVPIEQLNEREAAKLLMLETMLNLLIDIRDELRRIR